MKKTAKYNKIIVLIGLCLLYSCEDFIDLDQPGTQIVAEEVFNDKKMTEAAMAENYVRLRDRVLLNGNNTGLGVTMGLYTDELQNWLVTNTFHQSLYTNTLTESELAIKNIWDGSYQVIYQCNRIIEGVSSSTGIATADKRGLLGEAYFVRTLVHFYLSQLWGAVPYVTGTDYTVNRSVSKTPEIEMHKLLVTDAQKALELLEDVPSINNYRPNAATAMALLARIHLYSKQWQQALFYADELIASGRYKLESDLSKVFLKESSGTLWQLRTGLEGVNTLEAQTYIFATVPPPTISLTSVLVSSFDPRDKRRESWIAKPAAAQGFYYSNKYRERQNTSVSKEYSVVFRLEELYYIRIEANIQLGNYKQALDDWNMLRGRYGLELFSELPHNWEVLLLQERRHEFFCEFGHRFFDLKRTGRLASELVDAKPQWQAFFARLPLPQSELLLNPNLLPQNEGY
ncbi:RagB/SusD family nutrient uptake outer membrane protein [Flavobacterium sp. xlx-214]|uniref:RagB/SusD family nutrient uptake outer membrane protein n=1 Tax=unclassified Flavobacterium TaxID=196869 RepID=UPI0013D08044|nr:MULTISPECIES: RagB/SusD family nutrient uptake outer membrane protein [unclassified Flavobacterium]MBA5792695.1 RagB/SusD family nutrient uptake outer membrane protein [Flavobacterium sp. xlx-221]QMI83840.1 RagB/SusD family nutrient uptake outer membrane protein [Flavobacterium sp. xlx-214]